MNKSQDFKSIIKAAYLMQTRHGPLTEQEILTIVSDDELRQVIGGGYIIRHRNEARYSLSGLGRSKIRVVLAGGVYDVMHLGHLAALTEARSFGDVLIAVVATDITVEMLKGRKPIFPQEDRRKLVEGLKPVDRAILGYEDVGMGYEEVLMEVMPDIVAFGYDQENLERSVREIIMRRKLRIQMIKLSKHENERYLSSTSVRQKLSETLN
ncbi:MAG: adenylyltransferase/cytidyltransferase family protein [Candidatus Bathyarchaeia archaeon]